MQLQVEFKNNKQQLCDYNDYFMKEQTAVKRYRIFKRIVMIPIGVLLSIFILISKLPLMRIHEQVTPYDIVYIIAPTLIGILWFVVALILSYLIRRENFEDKLKYELINLDDNVIVNLLDEGINCIRGENHILYSWEFVKKIEKQNDNLFIVMRDNNGIVIPIDSFNEEVTEEKFIEYINKKISK